VYIYKYIYTYIYIYREVTWPLPRPLSQTPLLAFTRYCYYQSYTVYTVTYKREVDRGGVVYCPIVVQWYCNSVGIAGGPVG